jgi:hypothetical protein
MAKIAFILLCHKDPQAIIAQAERLTAAGDYMAIHFDGRANPSDFAAIKDALSDNPNVVFAKKRIKCGWGEWSLVQATLNAVEAAEAAFPRATHFYMLSGDCMAIKSAEYAHAFLDNRDVDYIESFDFFDSDWIKTGMKEDRLIYRHFFNERTQKRIFYGALNFQRRLGLKRSIPANLQMMIGSQWWCLRRHTIEAVLDFVRARSDVLRFFQTTWIPDETFFQTIVRHLVPRKEIDSRTLTFLIFTDYGMPVTFHNDHYDLLLAQDFLFARKISPDARALRERLGQLYATVGVTFDVSNEGRNLFAFLVGRGREGRRFSPRIWEAQATLGRERELLVITCKKWHVAKRLAEAIRTQTGIAALDYVFDEDSSTLPDLGGIECSLEKRGRHRRAMLRMVYEAMNTDRLVICVDPARMDLLRDFVSDLARTKLLEINCELTPGYLEGHARRVGLAGNQTAPDVLAGLLQTIRADLDHEIHVLRDAALPGYGRIEQSRTAVENALPLAAFLDINNDTARTIASTPHLFDD